MNFFAKLQSPLGPILLEAGPAGLSGLYFADQWDCPHVPGLDAPAHAPSRPADGQIDGRAIRTFRAVRAADREPDLFTGSASGDGQAARGGCDGLQWLTAMPAPPREAQAILQQTAYELDDYFRGHRRQFDVPLDAHGTAFQKNVWQVLLGIPCGETVSYGEVARRAGLERRHSRAVGAAVGSNPISIIIPCHRVLASNGTLNGYGGGLPRKVRLLQLEGFAVG